jgi:hypothetical protein
MTGSSVFERILPEKINNTFPGHKFAVYAFLAFCVFTVARSLAHMFLPDGGAESIATIDLSAGGADAIIGIFAQWGLSQLLMAGLYIVVYLRYKSLIPLMYVIIFAEYLGRIGMGLLKPLETVGTAPGAIGNLIIVPLAVVLFIFSIRQPNRE